MPQPNWYNDNANRAFPFEWRSVGVGVPESGPVTITQLPDDFIVDCGFTIGPASSYEEGVDYVYLSRIYRVGSEVYFEFKTSEASMADYPLTFIRSITDEEYSLEYLDSDNPSDRGSQASVSDSVGTACRLPFWSGYLVTGDMSSVAYRLADGESIVNSAPVSPSGNQALVEAALTDNLSKSIVSSFELANADRTRCTAPPGCPDPTWSFETGIIYESARCIQGAVKLKAGYNVSIGLTPSANTITLSAALNAGEGQPCEEVKLFPTESPPIGAENNLLEGGLLCNDVLRSINGLAGPAFKIKGGQGVSVLPDPDAHCVIIDVNLLNLDLCQYSYTSESL